MADDTPIMIWVTDRSGRVEFVNRAYADFFGVTLEEVRSGGWQPLVYPDDAAGYVGAFMTALRDRKPFRAQARVRRADGEWRWIDSHGIASFSPSGDLLGMAGSSPDITERIAFEQQLRDSAQKLTDANRIKDDFLATGSARILKAAARS